MQAKLAAAFLVAALLNVLVGLATPRLGLDGPASVLLQSAAHVGIGLGAAWWLSALLVGRLRALATAATRMSRGDLRQPVETSGGDETAELAQAIAGIQDNLTKVVVEVQGGAERIRASARELAAVSSEIDAATEEIAGTTRRIARGAEDQALEVRETTDTTRGLAEVAERVAARATDVHESACASADRAARGVEEARRAAAGIDELVRQAASATAAVEGFRLKASEIGNIVNFITSISHQTHLLAINAAIEAARAGEDGRGFGVVAEEVGGLADDVRRFAERISSLSDEIMQGARDVAEEIGKSAGSAETLREVVARGASAFDGILTAIRATADRVGEINELVAVQRRAASEVSRNLESISEIAARNVAGTEEATSATGEQVASARKMTDSARQLEHASEQLTGLVAVFRLR